jgi:hypothetical protein
MSQHIDTEILACSLHIYEDTRLFGVQTFYKKGEKQYSTEKTSGNVIAFDIMFLGEMEIQLNKLVVRVLWSLPLMGKLEKKLIFLSSVINNCLNHHSFSSLHK